jgi:hypothetical protein
MATPEALAALAGLGASMLAELPVPRGIYSPSTQ